MQIVFSILRLIFWATVVAIRLTLRFVIGVAAWLLGAYVGYRLVIAAEVKALSLCHAYSFPRKLCVRLMSLHGARASLRGRRGAAS